MCACICDTVVIDPSKGSKNCQKLYEVFNIFLVMLHYNRRNDVSLIAIIVNASHLKMYIVQYKLASAVEGSNLCVHSFSTTYEYTAHPSESNLFSHINLKFNFHPIFSWKNHTNCTRERLFKGNSHHQLNLYPLQMYA